MSRPPVISREDLLKAALTLFRENGVDRTTVSDIVKEAHVAQGTFYNYFRSKDDIFAAVLEAVTEHTDEEIQKTADRKDIGPIEKLNLLTQQDFRMNRQNDSLFDVLHESRYAYVHQKYIVGRIQALQPIYEKLIRQSVNEGYCDTPYPKEAALYLLTATKFVFDPAFFAFSEEEMFEMAQAVSDFSERILGTKHDPLQQQEWNQKIRHYFGGDKK
jgi:AcrR family transcriptional regulator